jgi:hypothetical protein
VFTAQLRVATEPRSGRAVWLRLLVAAG